MATGGPVSAFPADTPDPVATVPIERLSFALRMDGLEDEQAWEGIAPLPMTMYQPTFQGDMTERTEVRIGYDDGYLYVWAILHDSDPDGIMAGSLQRDGGSFADDYLNVVIDPFNDNENALWFYTNPAGIRGDMALSRDAQDMRSINSSWDGFWDVETRITPEGWTVEMRIPFSTLGFQSEAEATTMGVAISRVIARKNERHVYPAIPPDWQLGFAKPSVMQDVELTGVKGRRPLYITPYTRGGLRQTPRLNQRGDAYRTHDERLSEVGLDVRYHLSGNLVADLTVNTDFAQVEADDEQINLGRFSLFFPEKRQFFQERASLFDFPLGFFDRMFHSRQVGLLNGNPTRVFGGGRVVGRVGDWDLGVMSLQTDRPDVDATENFTIARTRKQVLNDNSWVGAMLTSRQGVDGAGNTALGLDGTFRIVGDEYLTVRVAQTADERATNTIGANFGRNGFTQLMWQRRRQNGFNYMMWATRWEEDFRPETGFYRFTDYTQGLVRLAYNWLPGESSGWRTIETAVFGNLSFANRDNNLETGVWGSSTSLQSKRGAEYTVELLGYHDRLSTQIPLPEGAIVPAGEHTYFTAEAAARSAEGRKWRLGGSAGGGQFFDGTTWNASLFPSWNASKHLELSGAWIYNRIFFADRKGFDTNLIRVKAQLAVNSKLSGATFVQYNSAAQVVGLNLRVRYNMRERNDLWLVIDDGLHTDRNALHPTLPVSTGRTIQAKYTYTFLQ